MAINEKYSYKSFGRNPAALKTAIDLAGTIVGSGFSQSTLDAHIFPDTMTGVVFEKCNLDNVYIPPGNTVDPSCSHKRFATQNDLEDWFIDGADKPVEPIDKKMYEKLKLSTDPKDIPVTPLVVSVTRARLLAIHQLDDVFGQLKKAGQASVSLADEATIKKLYSLSDKEMVLVKEML